MRSLDWVGAAFCGALGMVAACGADGGESGAPAGGGGGSGGTRSGPSTGGITGALRIAQLASTYGVPLAPHGVGSAVGMAAILHVLGAIPNAWIYEYNQLLNPLRDDLLAEPIVFRDGYLEIPTGPGLGIALQDGAFERYKLRG